MTIIEQLDGAIAGMEMSLASYDKTEEIQRLRAALDDAQDIASKALRTAWQLGQTYWAQADSEYFSQHKKADATMAKFQDLVDSTREAIDNLKIVD